MANFSFDVVSEYDKAELNNVFDQTQREINSRYDFKGTPASIEWSNGDKTSLKIIGNSEMQIEAILDILRKKLAARNQSQKILDLTSPISEANLKVTKEVSLKRGLKTDQAKQLAKLISASHPKIKTQIQGELIRVNSTSKDDLQAVMRTLNAEDLDFPLSFTNYR